MTDLAVRRAAAGDVAAVAPLVYSTAGDMYDLFLRDRERAVRFIERSFAAGELVWVAERDGRVAGVLVAFPADEAAVEARRFALMVLRRTPPWRWPGIARLHWLGARHAPRPRPGSLHVGALATVEEHRRRGVARALLSKAEAHARAVGLAALSVDTAESNEGAAALYTSTGFELVERREAKPPMPAALLFAKRLD